VETFASARGFAPNPRFDEQRRHALDGLDITAIDPPIVKLVQEFRQLPYCFTLQSCFGHFLYPGQQDAANVDALPHLPAGTRVEYRIAYVAVCLQDSPSGRALYDDLSDFPAIDEEYIQFGCAGWFWERQVNSYVLQVEPERFKMEDRAEFDYQEALHVEAVRNTFCAALGRVIAGRAREAQSRYNGH
jgi:hypothetical protein